MDGWIVFLKWIAHIIYQQGDIERSVYGSFTNTASKIYAASGIPGFYRGATFRYGRMCCAVFIMDLTKDFVSQLLYPSAFK